MTAHCSTWVALLEDVCKVNSQIYRMITTLFTHAVVGEKKSCSGEQQSLSQLQ